MRTVEPGGAGRIEDAAILLVEDDDGDAVLVQACLEEAGVPPAKIVWRQTLADALEALATHRPECVLLDLGLPDAEGFGAVHKIIEAAPGVAVIVLTGRQERDGVDALGAGAQDYLIKDAITADGLERSVRYACERVRAQREQLQLREARITAAEQARLERGLLPNPLLRTDAVRCSTYYQPGRDDAVLGGDFFDIVETADGRVHAIIGDVMGHGPDEAALGVHMRVAWRTLLLAGVPDAQILPTLDSLLGVEQPEHPRYVTACYVTVEPAGGGAAVRVAGHPAPVRCCDDRGIGYLDLHIGPPLGVRLPGTSSEVTDRWPHTPVALDPGASLILYTDGLLDAYDDSDELGIPQLVAAVRDLATTGAPSESWIATLVNDTPRESVDDTAVVVLTTRSGT